MRTVTRQLTALFRKYFQASSQTTGGGRRKSKRKRAFNLIKFTLADGTHYESISNILDLSENGLQFSCYEPLEVGAKLKMLIHVPGKKQDIPMKTRLVWIRKVKRINGVYIAGVVFEEIAVRDKEILKQIIEREAPDA